MAYTAFESMREVNKKRFRKKIGPFEPALYCNSENPNDLKSAARQQNADIALFGHTHVPYTEYDNGLWIMNPGALRRFELSYGLIDIQKGNVLVHTATFR